MDIIHTFTIAMSKYLTGILMCVAFIFSLSEIKGETSQNFSDEISSTIQNINNVYLSSPYDVVSVNNHFSPGAFNQQICDIPHSISTSIGGMNFSRNLKFVSTIQFLSSLTAHQLMENFRNQYCHYSFKKNFSRYYIYTLRSLLI